ncbi:penicillin-binding transpeptidase domain-containing protein [Clostridium transplantifaecale]|uniref:penicillin-binding transpeptidase domain-containing protein n=1 Tax=Clostridium transplantifaecale TaxID=2479838 RepID=UPI0013DDB569|nr:penicillin-binding transpeptidase domain-containing protein [Clostridium transplantifaecale]
MRTFIHHILRYRMTLFGIVMLFMGVIVARRFFMLQVVDSEEYQENFRNRIEREQVFQGSRGIIYDRNGTELAYNEVTYTVTIEDNGVYGSSRERNAALNEQISQAIDLIEKNGDSVINDFPISIVDSNYTFRDEGNRLLRFLADVYGHAGTDDLEYNERLGYDERTATAGQVMEYLCSERRYGIPEDYPAERALQVASVRFAMGSNNYQRYMTTDLAREVSQETMVAILENQPELPGLDVTERLVRRYTDSKYFAHLLGYTGPVSEEELEQLADSGVQYDRNDIVGKAGIEQSMERELHGRNGGERFYVDNVGRVTEILESTGATTGNNIYLSIDAELQKAVYDLLEQKLAGILLANITREPPEGTNDLSIPIEAVYFALIDNHVIDTEHFSGAEAGAEERVVSGLFEERLNQVMAEIPEAVRRPNQELGEEMQAYLDYALGILEEEGYYRSEEVDRNSELYSRWQSDEISLEQFLQGGIGEGWVSTEGLLPQEGSYTMIEENLNALESWIVNRLLDDSGFHELLYREMIRQGSITGEQISRILIEQGAVEDRGGDYDGLGIGTLEAYTFIRDKIRNLEITPAQLALDPSTASSVVVEPGTGKVLACVTYPGYDNNRLANSVDGDYYNGLLNDASLPLYNNATQQRTAPGSTFKPVTVAAGLTEQVIDRNSEIEDLGIFELITPSPRCWIYPSGATHGAINVTEALRDSCNYFFYTLGYEMSLENDVYRENRGIETIRKYTEMFGFNENTGIEIPESAPQMADGFPVTAAIGQSNHNYTTTQMARYAAALADKGNLHNLTLIDRVQEGADGGFRQMDEPDERLLEEILPSAWNTIGEGMRMMAENNRILRELPFSVAGKTGTAQQNRTRPNHALFIGYAPYEAPEIAVATRIAYGYASSNAVEVTSDILKYYFRTEDASQLLTGQAELPENRGNSFAD